MRIAFRLALRSALLDLHDAAAGYATALAARAIEHADAVWPDTTYLQPAQPSTFGHYLAGFAEQATRDLARIRTAHAWANLSPAGAGGVAGSTIPLDRERLAKRLGLNTSRTHIRDAMWSTDGLIDTLVAATQAVINADRLAEDLEVFAAPQFGYVVLPGSTSRASVLLPQKRNPYALAVIRGGAGTLIGRCVGLMSSQRTGSARTDNWLYAYGESVGALEMSTRLLQLSSEVVTGMTVDREALASSTGVGFSIATDLAERLVLKTGLDYRSAYRLVSKAVAICIDDGKATISPDSLSKAAGHLGLPPPPPGILESVTDFIALALGRDVPGGSAPGRVREICLEIEKRITSASRWSHSARVNAVNAEHNLIEEAKQRWK